MTFPIPFKGDDKPRGVCEAITLQRVHLDLQQREADLFDTKWFDYRWWHPVVATHYYVHCYIQAVKAFCIANKDRDMAAELKVFNVDDIFESRDLSAVITARQALDRIGCRYEWAMHIIVRRFSDRGWSHLPRPNQLYAEELMLDLADLWREECAIKLQIARDARFRLVDGVPLTDVQGQYVAWLHEEVRKRGQHVERPLGRLLKEGLLTDAMVAARYGDAVLRASIRSSGR